MNLKNRTCIICTREFKNSWSHAKYCSKECRNKQYARMGSGLPSNTVGSISELKVAIDLLLKGYSVFRSLSPACFCDLVAIKDKEFKFIEVRTGYKSGNGRLSFSKKLHNENVTEFAVYIMSEDKIYYLKT